jgi:hypothetical protein
VKKIKGLSVIEDRAYAQDTYTAIYLFTLDFNVNKRTKATYHDTGGLQMIKSGSGRRVRHVHGSTQQRRIERYGA